jgi:thymidylate synthase (FAD)
MAHARNEQADLLLDKEHGVLDHGFVRLIDYMGSDDAIVSNSRFLSPASGSDIGRPT